GRRAGRADAASPPADTSTIRGLVSAAVACIDVDIAMGQVAGPHRRLAAAEADIDADRDLAALHVFGDGRLLVIGYRAARCRDRDSADGDRQSALVHLFAGPAYRHDNTTPIRITRGKRRLDQR